MDPRSPLTRTDTTRMASGGPESGRKLSFHCRAAILRDVKFPAGNAIERGTPGFTAGGFSFARAAASISRRSTCVSRNNSPPRWQQWACATLFFVFKLGAPRFAEEREANHAYKARTHDTGGAGPGMHLAVCHRGMARFRRCGRKQGGEHGSTARRVRRQRQGHEDDANAPASPATYRQRPSSRH
jgi:hypothetical protein